MNKVIHHSGKWYHKTSDQSAKSIMANGFEVEHGGNQRFGEGVYFLSHSEGSFGEVCLVSTISGFFIDLSDDDFGDEWKDIKSQYFSGSWSTMTDNIKRDYPNADGILFPGMLVVFDNGLSSIKKTKYLTEETMKTIIRDMIEESIFTVSTEANTISLWHGGNLDDYSESVAHKKGRAEYGPGLYLTSSWNVVDKYRKGSRKLYMVTINKGNDIRHVKIDADKCIEFVNKNVTGTKKLSVLSAISRFTKDDLVPAYILNNTLVNNDAIKSSNISAWRSFLIECGADYEVIDNAFGWGEKMVVLYNMKMINNIKQFKPGDTIVDHDLPTEWN